MCAMSRSRTCDRRRSFQQNLPNSGRRVQQCRSVIVAVAAVSLAPGSRRAATGDLDVLFWIAVVISNRRQAKLLSVRVEPDAHRVLRAAEHDVVPTPSIRLSGSCKLRAM